MSWEKYDADRASNDKPRSADKLAEAVKSSLGDRAAAPRPGEHPGHVVHRPVESRPVESRPVEDAAGKKAYAGARKAAVKATADADTAQGHKAAAAAHREAARLSTTQAQRMLHENKAAEHTQAGHEVRSKAAEALPKSPARVTRPVRKTPGGSIERKSTSGTAAERLVEDRNARTQSHYEKVADRAEKASREANDAAGHTEAYRQHVHAANVAPTEELRTMHMKLAVSHDRANVYEKSTQARAEGLNMAKARAGQPTSPVKAPTVAERTYTGNRDRAVYMSAKASTASDHRAAAGAHDLAAKSAPTPVLEKMHEGKAVEHLQAAETGARASAAKTGATPAAAVKLSKTSTGAVKVTQGATHLGNVESRGGKYVAVVRAARGKLSTAAFDTHEEALDHIRQSHGLGKMSSAERLAARMR
ncbi:MAG TPA: hypothetical protein VGS97_20355 [Actinocrinis sp.]|uniref:hypothetical protein n=1 Tax=Actinocrinis sp. TaxID=1920516 RepID=UPI002DDD2AC9|nr:hypothetical protein [Actinocrinis sp.]HEV2346463.1 hypothetical protein [Actinocrinis sp.]